MFFARDPDYPVPIFFSGDEPSCIECSFVFIKDNFKMFQCEKTGEKVRHVVGRSEHGKNCPLMKREKKD